NTGSSPCPAPGAVSAACSALTAADTQRPPQEQPIELRNGEARPRRPSMIALARALGRFHLPQQRVHLGKRQAAVRVDRSAAGERGEEAVRGGLEVVRVGLEAEIVHDGGDDPGDLPASASPARAAEPAAWRTAHRARTLPVPT